MPRNGILNIALQVSDNLNVMAWQKKMLVLLRSILFRKSFDDNAEWIVGMMEYRNVPVSGFNLSPAQLLFGCRIKINNPILYKLLNAEIFKNIENGKKKKAKPPPRYGYQGNKAF